jgi:hypothetical protein
MITSSPLFQSTGVATECFAVSWSESITRRISSKLRPVLAGYVMLSLTFLSPDHEDGADRQGLVRLRWIMS